MNRKQKIIVSVTGIFLVLLILVGLTYAYFLTQITGNTNEKSISVITANLIVRYEDGTNVILDENTKLKPSSTAIGTKTFKVINEGDRTDYVVIIDEISITDAITGEPTTFKTNDFVYTLTCKNMSDNSDCTNEVNSQEQLPLTNQGILVGNDIESGETQEYTMTIWYLDNDQDQSDDMNKTLKARVNIEDIRRLENPYKDNTNSLAYNIINNSINTINGTKLVGAPITRVAEEINLENEKELSIAKDDFGYSYYYRGDVKDNYVNFAGMCWRIVRIDGVGNIKIILEDQNTTCDSDTFTGNWDIVTVNYGYDATLKNEEDKYILKKSFLEPKNEADKSMVKAFYDYQGMLSTKIQTMYSNKIISDYLISGNWCMNNTTYTRTEINGLYKYEMISDTTNYYLSGTNFFYDSYTRFGGSKRVEYDVTLKCSVPTIDKFKDVMFNGTKIISESEMFVATISADELVSAGGKYYTENTNYYLVNDYLKNQNTEFRWWTLSPAVFLNTEDYTFSMYNNGKMNANGVHYEHSIRPAISLKSGVEISSEGLGTIDKPYVIK